MRSSRTITLFAPAPPPARHGSSSLVVSVLVHGLAFGCLIFGVRTAPRVSNRTTIRRYTVRILNVPMPEPAPVEEAAGISAPHPVAKAAAPQPAAPGGSPASMPAVATQLAQLPPKTQILIQPDAPPDLLLQHPTPIPLVLKWTPPEIPVKVITPAPPTQKPLIAKLRPSIEPPNHELNPADFKMSSTNFATALPAIPPTTTSPLVVRGPQPAARIPETTAKLTEPPAPAQIMSFSDLQAQGPIAIPLANSPGHPVVAASPGVGPAVTSGEGRGNPASKQSGNGPGQSPGAAEAKPSNGNGAVAQTATNGPAQPSGSGVIDGGPGTSVTRVHLNKDGQFGVVVVGSTLAQQYPETVGLWGGRLVYTVYLHLGPGKAWILQYAVPPATQAAAPANNARPDAPWPYDIVQPHIDPNDYTSDAVMVHGFVNLAGRFERLAVVFPTEFAQAKFVLSALEQWQFRPARQNGQLAPVEVLLIIPDDEE